jgi:peptidoglycan/LPS O-acetylase OafA/YrhL
MVIFSHVGPLAGFYSGRDLGTQWSDEQSFGGVAIGGFFFLSGFLITRSKLRVRSTIRFFWHRFLRIFPGFLTVLIITAYVIAPLSWWWRYRTWDGYFTASSESPFSYVFNNMTLILNQLNIANFGQDLPLHANTGMFQWNGSIWTLAFEFGAYVLVGVLGLFGALANRVIARIVAFAIIGLALLQWLGVASIWTIWPTFSDYRLLLLMAPFAVGILFQLYAERIPIDDRLGVLMLAVAAVTYAKGGWLVLGQYAFCYALIWFAIRVQVLKNWDRKADFSYGLYLIGWPLTVAATVFGLQEFGWVVFMLVVVFVAHAYAFLSWHLIEAPAMSLKNFKLRRLRRKIIDRPGLQRRFRVMTNEEGP